MGDLWIWMAIERRVRAFLSFSYHMFGKELDEAAFHSWMQFVKFGLVGVSNTALSYLLNIGVLLLLGKAGLFERWDYVIANVIAFLVSVAWSFYWNNRYVFVPEEGESRNIGKALLKTYMSYAFTGILLANVLSFLWIDVLGISKYIAPLINLVFSVPINYLINRFWAFR